MTNERSSVAALWPRIAYWLLPVLPVPILIRELSAKKFPIHLGFAPHFRNFLTLFHYQEALFVALILAVIGLVAARLSIRWIRFTIYLPITLWAVWITFWAFVRARFMIQLSPRYALDVLIHPSAVAGVGLNPAWFYPEVAILFAIIFGLAFAGAWLSGKITTRFALRVALIYLALFLIVHIPVRAYVVHYVNRGQRAVMAMDDWTPLPLRTEFLIPGLRAQRVSLPNLETAAHTKAYVNWVKHRPASEIPRKLDIVWIVVESFRADAISEQTTPYLWKHADDFQVKLDRNHWSGGNASQFGLFSIFVATSGYHLQTFLREGVYVPFFDLLTQNGYRVRIANRHYFDEFGSFKSFFRPSMPGAEMYGAPDEADLKMTDALLADMDSRPQAPALDVVTFDATHWTFFYPSVHALFQPAAGDLRGTRMTRTRGQAEAAHNRFRNASHFVDEQIGRIMESLRARGTLDRTIVIVTGDHGEEFLERGQVFHGGAMDDYQGRPVLWMHFPADTVVQVDPGALTSHLDIVPTMLDVMGFNEDVLRTQGQSLLHPRISRKALFVSEQGFAVPFYNALVTNTYISRWHNGRSVFLFSGVDRRDNQPVSGDAWLEEARSVYPAAAAEYEVLPDVTGPAAKFSK